MTYGGSRGGARLLGALTALFALRVAGQAIQRWMPQPFLPDFAAFQGSSLPYWLLLTIQIMLLAVMMRAAGRVANGGHRMQPRAQRLLQAFGIVYMTGSLGRIAVGVALPGAPAWFTAWLPAFFHVVLAAFVLALARCHAASRPLSDDDR
jgi:hypothetical protein